jgi:hypothetical protein
MPPQSLRPGDIFALAHEAGVASAGQLLDKSGEQLLVLVMEGGCPDDPEAVSEAALSGRPMLLGITLDALFVHGRWKVAGNAAQRTDVIYPTFAVAVAPGDYVRETFHGDQLGRIADVEVDSLPPRKVVAPIRIERAARAQRGLGPWLPQYESLLIHRA